MSSIKFDPGPMGKAEGRFRDAFERLKAGKPQLLPKGTLVSQNKVAREAGVKPSALRASRFPKLVEEIQKWIDDNENNPAQKSPRQTLLAQRSRSRDLRAQMEAYKAQRDDALSKLVTAEARIVTLTVENERMRAQLPPGKVIPLRPSGKQ